MTIAAWPSTLPNPNQDDYGYTPQSGVAESNMDDGSVLTRRRQITTLTSVQVSWTLTTAQLADFESFFLYTILGGAAYFTTPLINGQGINQVLAQFDQSDKTSYSVKQAPQQFDSFVVTAKLRTMSMPVAMV